MNFIKFSRKKGTRAEIWDRFFPRFAGRIHRMIKLGLSIDDDDDAGDDDLPPLEEVEGRGSFQIWQKCSIVFWTCLIFSIFIFIFSTSDFRHQIL